MDYNDANSGRGEDKKLDKKVKWALAAASVCESAKGKKGRVERAELRWRIYERPKQAANPKPFACFSSSAFAFRFSFPFSFFASFRFVFRP